MTFDAITDEQIIAIRDECLPSQGEPFDCIAFARAITSAYDSPLRVDLSLQDITIRALRAQLKREPVAWYLPLMGRYATIEWGSKRPDIGNVADWHPLYT